MPDNEVDSNKNKKEDIKRSNDELNQDMNLDKPVINEPLTNVSILQKQTINKTDSEVSSERRKASKRIAEANNDHDVNEQSVIQDHEAFQDVIPSKAARKYSPDQPTQNTNLMDTVIDQDNEMKPEIDNHEKDLVNPNTEELTKTNDEQPIIEENDLKEAQTIDYNSKYELPMNEEETILPPKEDKILLEEPTKIDKIQMPDIKVDHIQETSSAEELIEHKLRPVPDLLVPSTSILKYDIPFFLGKLINEKPIPEPPKTKPPCLPDSIEHGLIASRRNSITTKPKESVVEDEAKDYYWDYEENCWKEGLSLYLFLFFLKFLVRVKV